MRLSSGMHEMMLHLSCLLRVLLSMWTWRPESTIKSSLIRPLLEAHCTHALAWLKHGGDMPSIQIARWTQHATLTSGLR